MRQIVADCLRGMVSVGTTGQVSWRIPDSATDVMPELIEDHAESVDAQNTE